MTCAPGAIRTGQLGEWAKRHRARKPAFGLKFVEIEIEDRHLQSKTLRRIVRRDPPKIAAIV
jgi:hypothetical protein